MHITTTTATTTPKLVASHDSRVQYLWPLDSWPKQQLDLVYIVNQTSITPTD